MMIKRKRYKLLIKAMIVILLACALLDTQSYAKQKKKHNYEWKTITIKVKKKKYLGKFYVTHYCPCQRCCGYGGGKVTASGTTPKAGRTVGVNPQLIPYGSKLKVGKQTGYVAEDTGGGIGWKHLDIYCNSHQEALNAGVGYEKVWVEYYTTKKIRYKLYKAKTMKFRNTK